MKEKAEKDGRQKKAEGAKRAKEEEQRRKEEEKQKVAKDKAEKARLEVEERKKKEGEEAKRAKEEEQRSKEEEKQKLAEEKREKVRLAAEERKKIEVEEAKRAMVEEQRSKEEEKQKLDEEKREKVRLAAEERKNKEVEEAKRAKEEAQRRKEEEKQKLAEEKAERDTLEAEERKKKEEDDAKKAKEEEKRRKEEEKQKLAKEKAEKARLEAEERKKKEVEDAEKAKEEGKRRKEEENQKFAKEKARQKAEERELEKKNRPQTAVAEGFSKKQTQEAETPLSEKPKQKIQLSRENATAKAMREGRRKKTEREAQAKAKKESEEKAEKEAKEKAQRETQEKAERESKEKTERQASEKAMREARRKTAVEAMKAKEEEKRRNEEEKQKLAEEKARQEADERELEKERGRQAAGVEFSKKQPQEAGAPEKPKPKIQLSEAQILRTLEDWIFKHQQRMSMEDTGGIDRDEMIEAGIRSLETALGITASSPPFTVELDGDCLWNALSIIANPNLSKEANARAGTVLRRRVMEEAIEMVRTMSSERLELIQAAAAPDDRGEPLTREELVTLLRRYQENGRWEGALGDLMPQIAASFTRTPLLVIWIGSDSSQTTGNFVNPQHVFHQPNNFSVLNVVVRYHNHYESLIVPADANEALMEVYRSSQQLGMAAIQLPGPHMGGRGVNEGPSTSATTTSAATAAVPTAATTAATTTTTTATAAKTTSSTAAAKTTATTAEIAISTAAARTTPDISISTAPAMTTATTAEMTISTAAETTTATMAEMTISTGATTTTEMTISTAAPTKTAKTAEIAISTLTAAAATTTTLRQQASTSTEAGEAADQPTVDPADPASTAAEATDATKAKETTSTGATSDARMETTSSLATTPVDSQADGAFLRQLLNPSPEAASESPNSAAVRRRHDAGRPVLTPLLQLTDGLKGSITAGLNVFLSTELAVFLRDLPNVQSPFLKLLQQYVLAPPGTRGTTDELCRLMEEEVPEVLNLTCRNDVRNSIPIEFLENLIFSIGRLLSEDQLKAWKKMVNVKFTARITCRKCNKSTRDTKSTLVLPLPLVDQHNQPVESLRQSLQALKDHNEDREVNKACIGCGAGKTTKRSTIFDPPRVLILCFKKKKTKIEVDYEIFLPNNQHRRYRLTSIISDTNDRRFYAEIVDAEQGVWISDQDQEPRQASVAEFNEAMDNGHIFVYRRLSRTQSRCDSDFF